ncbi:MAG: type II toxin-antitoxin system prevent-host-death family antitoxin [Proteobacteria bacterium]|nr:type II toxin-antitoxin system prevent-host-death family antitoxin [Pseudomonadota bacterium]
MREVGASEAKTHLSELLAAVEAGERIVVARRGRAIGELRPVSDARSEGRRTALAQAARLRAKIGSGAGGLSRRMKFSPSGMRGGALQSVLVEAEPVAPALLWAEIRHVFLLAERPITPRPW